VAILFVAACAPPAAQRPSRLPLPIDAHPAGPLPEAPYVATSVEFPIRLEDPVGTSTSSPGQPFRARVIYPVRSAENEIVVPADALVRGQVLAIVQKPVPSLRLRFRDVETVRGRAPLAASIESAAPFALTRAAGAAPWRESFLYAPGSSDPNRRGPESIPLAHAAVGGGPPAVSLGSIEPEPSGVPFDEVDLPVGAALRVVLTAPIVPPAKRR
jgi:hypothetical protein